MYTHAIVGHAVLVPLVLALLGAIVLGARRSLGSGGAVLGEPLDLGLVERWNLRSR